VSPECLQKKVPENGGRVIVSALPGYLSGSSLIRRVYDDLLGCVLHSRSSTRTKCLRVTSISAMWEPIKPAPPVIRIWATKVLPSDTERKNDDDCPGEMTSLNW
jgi:hypothetical protein